MTQRGGHEDLPRWRHARSRVAAGVARRTQPGAATAPCLLVLLDHLRVPRLGPGQPGTRCAAGRQGLQRQARVAACPPPPHRGLNGSDQQRHRRNRVSRWHGQDFDPVPLSRPQRHPLLTTSSSSCAAWQPATPNLQPSSAAAPRAGQGASQRGGACGTSSDSLRGDGAGRAGARVAPRPDRPPAAAARGDWPRSSGPRASPPELPARLGRPSPAPLSCGSFSQA